jgi:O-antigen/teichoic acid export membrane protein
MANRGLNLFRFALRLISSLRSDKYQRRLRILAIYTAGQGLVQLSGLVIGLSLLRLMNVDYYAQFSVAFGFQTTLGILTDLGFSGTIIALVGPRGQDPNVVGAYIRSGIHMRNVMLAFITPIAAVFYVGIARLHHWGILTSALLFLSIVASINFTGMASYYGAPLVIRGRLAHFYRHQFAGAIFRIIAGGVLYLCGGLNAWTMSWANALGFLLIGWLNKKESLPFMALPVHPRREATRQMVRYVTPILPSVIFFALQGQLSLFLISFFGHTRSIAEVAALGRLAQIFFVLSGFNAVVIEPFMARLPNERVFRSFLTVLAAALSICFVISLCGFIAPRLFLFVLGAKYASLQRETGWMVLGSCMAYLVGVIWTMNAARRWVYWATSWVTIGLILCTQIVFVWLVRMDSTMHVVWFGAATSAAHLASMIFNSIYGSIRGPKVEIPQALMEEQIQLEALPPVG